MNRIAWFSACLLLAGQATREAFAMGGDHRKEQLAAQGPSCVHGYFINASDVYFHTGDAADFNKFAADLVKRAGRKVQIVIHADKGRTRSPWDERDRDIPTDWTVTSGPLARRFGEKGDAGLVRIDLWLQGRVQREDVKFPPEAEVVSTTGFRNTTLKIDTRESAMGDGGFQPPPDKSKGIDFK